MIILLIILLLYFHKRKYEKFVLSHDNYILEMNYINSKYKFNDLEPLEWCLYSDNEYYENVYPIDLLTYILKNNKSEVLEHRKKISYNSQLYEKYLNDINNIKPVEEYDTINILRNKDKLIKIRKKYMNKLMRRPIVNFAIKVSIVYDITFFRNRYKQQVFDFKDVNIILSKLANKRDDYYLDEGIWQSLVNVERAKVTNRLKKRIKIRDRYRCQYCGSTTDLEIDHIVPISKGGVTKEDNLQTLCHSCNINKGNIIPPYAVKDSEYGYCNRCGAPLKKKNGKYGVFYGCANYPNCTYTTNKIKK